MENVNIARPQTLAATTDQSREKAMIQMDL